MLVALELLVEYDIFAGKQESRGQKIVLTGFFVVSLLVKGSLVLLEIFTE